MSVIKLVSQSKQI